MIQPVSHSSGSDPTSGATQSTSGGGTADQTMFLQLLVAQLKNQDPLKPTDATQFVTELAQFQQVEASLNTGQDVSAIRQDLEKFVNPNQTSQTSF